MEILAENNESQSLPKAISIERIVEVIIKDTLNSILCRFYFLSDSHCSSDKERGKSRQSHYYNANMPATFISM